MFGRLAATGYSTREKECYSALLFQAIDLDPFIRSLVMWCIRVKIDRCGARDEDFGTFICNDWTTNQYFVAKKVKFFCACWCRFIQDDDSHRQHNLDIL